MYQSEGRKCIADKCGSITFPSGFSQSIAKSCGEPLDTDSLKLSRVESLEGDDWLGFSQDLELWLVNVRAQDCTYFYQDPESLQEDYKETFQ